MNIVDNRIEIWPTGVSAGPSYPEQLGLSTLTNVTNTGTHWEAANPAVAARIDTALDLRGKVSDYTVIVDFEAVPFATQGDKQELAGQGAAYSFGIAICSLVYLYSGGSHLLAVSQEVAGARGYKYAPLSGALEGRHQAAAVISVADDITRFSIYLDGVLLSSQFMAGIPTGICSPVNSFFSINDNRAAGGINHFGKIYSAALFNEALTAGQIAYLSN